MSDDESLAAALALEEKMKEEERKKQEEEREKERLEKERKRQEEMETDRQASEELLPDLDQVMKDDPDAYLDIELEKETDAITEYTSLVLSGTEKPRKKQHTMESWSD